MGCNVTPDIGRLTDDEHEEMQSLLGAFALNATSAIEARRVERHLEKCDDCANEVRLLKEAAAELAWLSEPADTADLEQRITTNLPARRRTMTVRILAGAAAVAVVISGVLGASLIRERSLKSDLEEVLTTATRQVLLDPQGGFQGRGVLHVGRGKGALVLEDMPEAGKDRIYQLWALAGATPRSATFVEGTGHVVHLFDWTGRADDRFAITIEPEGGSPVPTSDPVLVGT